jgi:hypothetical protein
MSAVRVLDASDARLERWDEQIESSVNGTLFHLRRFLAYHGERFRESERFLVVLDGDTVIAQIAAAVIGDESGSELRSPYGASYGGFAFQRYPGFHQACEIVEALLGWCEGEGIKRVTLTPPIGACAALPLDTAQFALLHAGFRSTNRDISSVVPLAPDRGVSESVSSRARNTARRAEREGVTVTTRAPLADFWSVMEATFDKHGAPPTHTAAEFSWLADEFPDRVYADVAYHDREPVAGVGYFVINRLLSSSFYFCQRPDRRELNGLTMCVLDGLERARLTGHRWFDFGTSTAGMQPRENVFRFKEQFGGVGQFRETFEWAR